MLFAKLPPPLICLARQLRTLACRCSSLQNPRPLCTFIFKCSSVTSSRSSLSNFKTVHRYLTTMSVQTNQQQKKDEKVSSSISSENRAGSGGKIIWPPAFVRGMTTLDVEAFKKTITVPFVITTTKEIGNVRKVLSPVYLKMPSFKPLVAIPATSEEQSSPLELHHQIYLNPDMLTEVTKRVQQVESSLIAVNVEQQQFIGFQDITLTYENFSHHDVLRAILPDTMEAISGFSTIGHLLHVNLRNEALPYKQLIGQVLLDKIQNCRLVINKLDTIDSTYRNFALEVLASKDESPTTVVTTTESELRFSFDFAKVYWNPRLSAERDRINKKLLHGADVLYDVFAGVGPFALSAARYRKVRVLANDLNPHSYESLCSNVVANKLSDRVSCSNLDGRAFIRELVRADLLNVMKNFDGTELNRRYHVVMNLPDSAVDFLDAFDGLLVPTKEEEETEEKGNKYRIPFLNIHCYCFVKGIDEPAEAKEYVIKLASTKLGHPIPPEEVEEVYNVRKVAPAKYMYRISFRLAQDILYSGGDSLAEQSLRSSKDVDDLSEVASKRPKLE